MSTSVWTLKEKIDDAKARELDAKGEFDRIYRTLAILATVPEEIRSVCGTTGGWGGFNGWNAEKPSIRPNTTITHTCKSRYGNNVEIKLHANENCTYVTYIAIDGEICQIRSTPGGIETKGGAYIQSDYGGAISYRPI